MEADTDYRELITKFSGPNSYHASDKRNHCTPILDWVDDPELSGSGFAVLPPVLAGRHEQYEYVSEVVAFVNEVLEGLAYMHQNGVARCFGCNAGDDFGSYSISGKLVSNWNDSASRSKWRFWGRNQASRCEYATQRRVCFNAFHHAVTLSPDSRHRAKFDDGTTRPMERYGEVSLFDNDVAIVANVIKKKFMHLLPYQNVLFLNPLINAMTTDGPERVNAAGALALWGIIRNRIPESRLKEKLCEPDSGDRAAWWIRYIATPLFCVGVLALHAYLKSLLPIPSTVL